MDKLYIHITEYNLAIKSDKITDSVYIKFSISTFVVIEIFWTYWKELQSSFLEKWNVLYFDWGAGHMGV